MKLVISFILLLSSYLILSGQTVDSATGITYEIMDDNTVKIVTGPIVASGPVYEIPAYIDSKPVTIIGQGSYFHTNSNSRSFTTLIVPHTVTEIEYNAFRYCYSLQEVIFLGNSPLMSNSHKYSATGYGRASTYHFESTSLSRVIINGNDSNNFQSSLSYVGYADPVIELFLVFNGVNPSFSDSDHDGIADPYETNTGIYVSTTNTGTNPNENDTDGDGLNDAYETMTGNYISLFNTGTNPNENDTDGDGLNDLQEIYLFNVSFDPNSNSQTSVDSLNQFGFLTEQEIQDLRPGSTMIAVENGEAILSMELEKSDDLEIWTSGGTTNLQIPLDNDTDTKFFRFKLED